MPQKLDSIQALRGFAITYIVLFHAGNIFGYTWFVRGASALSLFFLISGFTLANAHRSDRGLASALLFAKKRMARLYGPYWIAFFAMLALILASGKGSAVHRDPLNILRNFLLIQAPSQSIHPYAWYLVYQMYYYAVFGLLAIGFRLGTKTCAFLLITPFLLSLLGVSGPPTKDSVPFAASSVLFASGLLLGDFFPLTSHPCGRLAVSMAGGLFLAAPFLSCGFFSMTLITVGFFYVCVNYSGRPSRWLSRLGNASYSIYLMHAIVLAVLKNTLAERSGAFFTVFVTGSFLVGMAYHYYAEESLVRAAQRVLLTLGEKQAPAGPPQDVPVDAINNAAIPRVEL